MAIEINGQIYYRTSETCQKTGISRATLLRWLKGGILEKPHLGAGQPISKQRYIRRIEGSDEDV